MPPAAPYTISPGITLTGKQATTTTVVVSFIPVPSGTGNPPSLEYWPFSDNRDQPHSTVAVQTKAASTTVSSATATGGATTSDDKPAQPTIGAPSTNSLDAPVSTSSTSGPAISTHAPKNDGIKPAAAAGIGVGCLLAGALIAGLLAWLFMKRRRPASGMRDSETSTVALMHREKGPMAKAVSVSSGSPIASALENGLPQPLEDKAISGEISKISNLIKNHVQSYYHGRAVSPGIIDYDDLQALGENLPVSVGTLSTLLNNSATREIALRFCLAWVVTSRIQLNDSSNTTFLPPEVAKCMQSINHADHRSQVRSLFYIKWRALTAELMQPTYIRNPFSANDGRIRNIQAAATLLDSVLRPFADSRIDDGARSRNLEEMLKRSAQFAFTLFSQPTTWNFDWQNEQGVKSGSLCIFPALVQVADENGEPIHPPRPFSEAVNRRLDD
ncbi:hypothetical protein P171DRAFT_353176 [Karstenula rhodostoma CBS 690.94]|uniref:Mid2 domain-containing protein n=1 Tax=Karstenula rhodostoma CBS 690.94 TaxID=1392251 RepID=A0A9P4PSC7_9PLEO|nr:hypothetical protein P171DRAFT_353176 [Karstenula rhodostoma CBS 690.94]